MFCHVVEQGRFTAAANVPGQPKSGFSSAVAAAIFAALGLATLLNLGRWI